MALTLTLYFSGGVVRLVLYIQYVYMCPLVPNGEILAKSLRIL
jgi:hypothetical protein